jgi:hypothetical protein
LPLALRQSGDPAEFSGAVMPYASSPPEGRRRRLVIFVVGLTVVFAEFIVTTAHLNRWSDAAQTSDRLVLV